MKEQHFSHRLKEFHLRRNIYDNAVTESTKDEPTTTLDDIFISVKTAKTYHESRLALILRTWFQLAKDQVRYENWNTRRNTSSSLQIITWQLLIYRGYYRKETKWWIIQIVQAIHAKKHAKWYFSTFPPSYIPTISLKYFEDIACK